MEHTFFVGTFIGVRTEVVALRLNQVGRQYRSTVAVVVGHRSGEGRNRNTVLHSVSNDVTQRLLIFVRDFFEVRSQQQVRNARIFCVGIGDFLQELRTNDAASAENLRDFAVVQVQLFSSEAARS